MSTQHADVFKGGTVVAVADVGNASAGVAIFVLKRHAPAHLLLAARQYVPLGRTEATLEALYTECGAVIEQIAKEYAVKFPGGKRVQAVHLIVHSPWIRSKTVRMESVFADETIVRGGMISSLARSILAQEHEYEHAEIVEKSIIRTEVNGYVTKKPEGKRGNSLAVSALLSACDVSLRGRLEDMVLLSFGVHPVIHSGAAVLNALVAQGICVEDATVVDMTGESTCITSIRSGLIVGEQIVPEGVHSIVRRVAGTGLPEETLALIRMVSDGRGDDAACEAVKTAMSNSEPELARLFGEPCATLAAKRRLPNQLYLLTHPDLMPWFTQFFSRIDFAQCTLTLQPYTVLPLTARVFDAAITLSSPSMQDSGLLADGILVNSSMQDEI